ncbi:MAG: signal peptide peptidase SppA [Bacteroidota bacterium]
MALSKQDKSILLVVGLVFGLFVLFIFFGLTAIVFFLRPADQDFEVAGKGEKVAVVELRGLILDSREVVRQFKKYRENKSVKGIVFRVESPGGAVVPSQEIYEEVKKTRDSGKAVVVSIGSLGASGGYYVSCGATRIVANPGSITGSIGVISQFLHYDELMDKLGIAETTIKSGKFKDAGSWARRMNEQEKKYFQNLMDDVHGQFIGVVEVERNIDHDRLLEFADGRVFTGRRALEFGLVDTLGTYEDAIAIAAELSGIKGKPAIVKERKRRSIFDVFLQSLKEVVVQTEQEMFDPSVFQYRYVGPY